jgi:SPP1 family holin
VDKASFGRIVALIIVLVNAVLNLMGYKTIPDEFGDHISSLLLIVVSLWTAWKNNYITRKGQKQKEVLKIHGLTNSK